MMNASRLFLLVLATGLSADLAYAQSDDARFAKIFDVTDLAVEAEPGEDFDILSVEATGMVNTGGWSEPQLAAWSYIEAPDDGMLDLDFLARMPSDDAIVTMALEDVTATLVGPMPPWVKGVRVHASNGSLEAMLTPDPDRAALSSSAVEGNVLADEVLPWPWKYFTPQQSDGAAE